MAAITICSDFGAPKIKSDTLSTVSPSISHEVMGPDAMILVFRMLIYVSLIRSHLFIFPFVALAFETEKNMAKRNVNEHTAYIFFFKF